jgi:hypothetical protein
MNPNKLQLFYAEDVFGDGLYILHPDGYLEYSLDDPDQWDESVSFPGMTFKYLLERSSYLTYIGEI